MPEQVTFDPTSEDAANSPLSLIDITTANPVYGIVSHSYPAPPLELQYAGSVDTEGDVPSSRRYRNRVITITVEVSTAAGLKALQAKTTKIGREGGTLQRTMPDATIIVFDLLASTTFDPGFDITYSIAGVATVTLTLDAKPFGRSPEVTLASHPETTLPALVFTETGIAGDVPALGRLVVTEGQAVDQKWLTWGVQSRNYSSAATAALYYEAEALTPLGSASVVTGLAGASGATNNVIRDGTLSTEYRAVLSTQASGGGAHKSHVGSYRVFARVAPIIMGSSPTSVMSFIWEWATGDYTSPTQNAAVSVDRTMLGTWRLVDLGIVTLPKVAAGTQRWEGRLLVKAQAAGDDVDVDYIMFEPVDEGSGQASALTTLPAATTYAIVDDFDQVAGALVGKVMPAGGTWAAGLSPTTDFSVNGSGAVTRNSVSDATARVDIAGTTTFTNTAIAAQIQHISGSEAVTIGVVGRWVDANNYIAFTLDSGPAYSNIVYARLYVAGVQVAYWNTYAIAGAVGTGIGFYSVQFVIYADGSFKAWVGTSPTTLGAPMLSGWHSALATGGALASGKVGMFDQNASAGATNRTYRYFYTWVPPLNAVIYGSQKAEIRSDRVTRTDPTGTVWTPPSAYAGDYLTVPVAGAEGRSARFLVKASRSAPGAGADTAIDDISAQLFVTPRWLSVPS